MQTIRHILAKTFEVEVQFQASLMREKMEVRVENHNNLFFARKGYYKGKEVTITHRDPKSGQVWLEDYPVSEKGGHLEYGVWVDADSVNQKDTVKNVEAANRKRTHRRKKANAIDHPVGNSKELSGK